MRATSCSAAMSSIGACSCCNLHSESIPLPIRKLAAVTGNAILPTGFRGRNWVAALGTDFKTDLPPVDGHFVAKRASCADGGQLADAR